MLIYIHGNCQARALELLMSPAFPSWSIRSYEVFTDKITTEIDQYQKLVKSADIIISQPVHDNYRSRDDLSLNWVKAEMKPGATLLVFPSMYFRGQLLGCVSLPFPAYEIPYHDILFVDLIHRGLTALEAAQILQDPGIFTEAFIDSEIDISVREMRRREKEDAVDIPLSPFLEQNALEAQIFHVINHPLRPTMVYMANAILRALGYHGIVPAEGRDHLSYPHIPCLPAVRRRFRQDQKSASGWLLAEPDKYYLKEGKLSPADYYSRYASHIQSLDRQDVAKALSLPQSVEYLTRLRAAVPGTVPHNA